MRSSVFKISCFVLFITNILIIKNVLAIKYSSCKIKKDEWFKIIDFDKDSTIEIYYNECKLNLKDFRYLVIPIQNKSSEKLLVDAIWGNGKKWLDLMQDIL